jgi:hypothetical protein
MDLQLIDSRFGGVKLCRATVAVRFKTVPVVGFLLSGETNQMSMRCCIVAASFEIFLFESRSRRTL